MLSHRIRSRRLQIDNTEENQVLAITRRPRETVLIGDDIVIQIIEVRGEKVRLAIEAPRDVKILRGEVKDRDAEQQ